MIFEYHFNQFLLYLNYYNSGAPSDVYKSSICGIMLAIVDDSPAAYLFESVLAGTDDVP